MSRRNVLNREKYDKNLLICVLCSLFTASVALGYFIYKGNGAFTVASDFNGQQLTFTTAVKNALLSKPLGQWVWNLDIGSSLINGFSFYNLGSPFFWISMIFSKISFPYMAGYLYIIKYVVASVTAYYYIKLFVKDSKYAVIGALLYAFSGFQTTNLAFFHFHDVVALFPLLLIGLELTIKDSKNSPFFIFAVFLNCINNYFFFTQEVIFLIIYFLIRFLRKVNNRFMIDAFKVALYGLLGIGMSAILFIPNIIYVMGNPRSQSTIYLKNIVYDAREFLFILKGMFLPGEAMGSHSILIESNFYSTSCYIPLFGMIFAIAYVIKKRDWLSKLIITLFAISFCPLMQSVFILFKGEFIYQRWWYMFVLILALATSLVIENHADYSIGKYSLVYAMLILIFYLALKYLKFDSDSSKVVFSQERFQLSVVVAICGALIIALFCCTKQIKFGPLMVATMIFGAVTTFTTLSSYRRGTNTYTYMAQYKTGEELNAINQQYRYNSGNNVLTMTGEGGGTGSFSSTIENTSREFDKLFDDYDIVNTRGTFLHNDYTIDTPMFGRSSNDSSILLLGGKYAVTQNGNVPNVIRSYKNNGENYYIQDIKACPIGFAVSHYITKQDLLKLPKEKRAVAMMNAAVIAKKTIDKVNSVADKADTQKIDYKNVEKNIDKTLKERVKNFKRDNTGFSCSTDYKKGKLVWFSVPYDKGWDATLDGKKIEIIKSAGMMAVKVPKGEHNLVFKYHTPGFKLGIIVSIISFIVFGIYTAMIVFQKKRVIDI